MEEEKKLTGYPSIDKPWLKYYPKEAFETPMPKCSIYEYLWQNNKNHPDDIAIVFYDKKITYRELFKNIDIVARAFASVGVKENDVVTLMMLNQPETVYCFYALSKLGAVTCVINLLSSIDEIEHYLSEGKSRFLVTLDAFFEKAYAAVQTGGVEKLIHVPLVHSRDILHRAGYRRKIKAPKVADPRVLSWQAFLHGAQSNPLPKVTRSSSDCALIGHTTGTTGFPKGIMLSDDACNAIPAQQIHLFGHVRQDSLLNLVVPFALYGLLDNLHVPLSFGMKTILIPKVDPNAVDEIIIKFRPNYVASIPIYWTSVINSKKIKDLSFLKMAAAGGAGLSYEQLVQLNEVLKRYYASTEMLTGYGMSEVGSIASAQMNGHAVPHSVGLPLPQNIIGAFDPETLKEKRYNEIGELCIYSPSTMLGYLENEEATTAALKQHDDGRVWMHSGDLGYVDENGDVFIQGRMKRIYLTVFQGAPYKINPNRIEEALIQHDAVSECGVVCISNGPNIYLPIAFCVLHEGCSATLSGVETELRELSKVELPEFDAPARYFFQDSLPHTAQGKIDYLALEELAKTE